MTIQAGDVGANMTVAGQTLYAPAVRQIYHHFALVYQHAQSKLTFYLDGLKEDEKTATINLTSFVRINVGYPAIKLALDSDIAGHFSNFRVFTGVAVWTDNFVPPDFPDS